MTRVFVVVASLVSSALAGANCWPRFRGPNGAGLATSAPIPVQWSDKDYLWKVELPGKGHSSPVVWGERLFVASGLPDATRIITCLSTRDGRMLWEKRYPSKPHSMNPLNSYATSTPALDAERLYLYWTTPEAITVLALDHDGNEVWQRDLGPFDSQHGSGTSPIVFDDLLIVPNDQRGKSFIIALDCRNGETRWKLDRRVVKAAYSTPCIYQPEGGPPELILTSTSHGVSSVDPRTGKVNWEFPTAFPLRVVSSPVMASGLIVGTCGVGGSGKRLVAVRPGSRDGRKPELAYEMKRNVPYVPTPPRRSALCHFAQGAGLRRRGLREKVPTPGPQPPRRTVPRHPGRRRGEDVPANLHPPVLPGRPVTQAAPSGRRGVPSASRPRRASSGGPRPVSGDRRSRASWSRTSWSNSLRSCREPRCGRQ